MRRILFCCALLTLALPFEALATADPAPRASLIVKLRGSGPHAVRDCAETRHRNGLALRDSTADRSASLDAVMEQTRTQQVRAVFRRPDGQSFDQQERGLRERWSRIRAGRTQRTPARSTPSDPAGLAHVYRVELAAGVALGDALQAYTADPHVEYAQPNFAVDLDRTLNDPFLASSGSWGQPHSDLWGLDRIGAPAAWDRTLGEGTVIAIVDTGVDLAHPDIVENLWVHPGEDLDGDGVADPEEWNGIDDDGNGFIDDLQGFDFDASFDANDDGDFDDPGDISDPDPQDGVGHGTHVAGTAAARGDNGIGIAGVAPRARVMPIKIFPDDGGSADNANTWRAVVYAAENGADVINASWSCSPRCPSNPLGEEVARLVHDLGVVFVTSAGNRADDATYSSPERLPETITVGAGTPNGALARFSSFGWVVDLVAPGEAALSLAAEGATRFAARRFVGEDYLFLEGTSMATPHVSGVVALMLAQDPTLRVDEVRARLRRTAEDVGAAGPDRHFGHGWVRPDRALADTIRPDARARFDGASIGARWKPQDGPASVRGFVLGADVARATLELGEGGDPSEWDPLAELGVGDFDVAWDASERTDGPYVLRLRVETRQGDVFTEYAPVSLDRTPPRFVSPPGQAAQRPDIAGTRVVWSARGVTEDGGLAPDLDLWLGAFGIEDGAVVADTDRHQTRPRISRRGLAWRERPLDAAPNDRDGLAGCVFRRGGDCRPDPIATDPSRIRRPATLVGRSLLYAEQLSSGFALLRCRLGPRPCAPQRVSPILPSASEVAFDGRHALFSTRTDGQLRLMLCDVRRRTPCTLRQTPVTSPIQLVPKAYRQGILLYEDIDLLTSPQFDYRLFACALDPSSGACDPIHVATEPGPFDVALSQGRIVWTTFAVDGTQDLAACRLDLTTRRCPVQRITVDPGRQQWPRIDGHRVVWQDDRDGPDRIASLALPTLAPIASRTVRARRSVSLVLRETSGAEAVSFEGFDAAGDSLETRGVRLFQRGGHRAHVRWRPQERDVGLHEFRFRVTLPSGLYDERTVRIEVLPPR